MICQLLYYHHLKNVKTTWEFVGISIIWNALFCLIEWLHSMFSTVARGTRVMVQVQYEWASLPRLVLWVRGICLSCSMGKSAGYLSWVYVLNFCKLWLKFSCIYPSLCLHYISISTWNQLNVTFDFTQNSIINII